VLRFNEEHPGRTLLVAGHTDTAASEAHNDELSRLRAKVALALLEGDRDTFRKTCQSRHKVSDIKQVLSWVSRALEGLTFDCDPGQINDVPAPNAVRKFQEAFNANKAALGSTAADLTVDGDAGELTWGAVFDCYEFAMREELGEDAAGVAALRAKLRFADDQRRSLGFGERFPVEELGVDQFRSQTNRRVEIIFFEPGETPDLAKAEDDPDTAELYLPGHFQREALPPMVSVTPWRAEWDALDANMSTPRTMRLSTPGAPPGIALLFTVSVGGGPVRSIDGSTADDGAALVYSDFDVPDELPPAVDLEAGQPFPPVTYTFTVEGGGRIARSRNELLYADRALVRLVVDPGDGDPEVVLANEPYLLFSPWGRRAGVTDENGVADERGLPPGSASIVIRERHLFNLGILPHNWDAP
jgi:hypothetical protein